ncbi:hypothetical protein [Nocardia sp. NPDC050435]|uniref:hypothetical protein n=1 Tax=Nocardia sp. NPDC050435 TaxID=3155040 RepID=UPI0033C86287
MMRRSIVRALLASSVLVGGCSSDAANPVETFTVSGTYENQEVNVQDLQRPKESAAAGVGCEGFRSSPIKEGGPITVIDGEGKTLAGGSFSGGRWVTGRQGCVFSWTIPNVPAGSKSYQVMAGQRAKAGPFTETEIRNPLSLTWKPA